MIFPQLVTELHTRWWTTTLGGGTPDSGGGTPFRLNLTTACEEKVYDPRLIEKLAKESDMPI